MGLPIKQVARDGSANQEGCKRWVGTKENHGGVDMVLASLGNGHIKKTHEWRIKFKTVMQHKVAMGKISHSLILSRLYTSSQYFKTFFWLYHTLFCLIAKTWHAN